MQPPDAVPGIPPAAVDDIGSGPPIVLLHAFPLDRRMWRAQIDAFSIRYRVLALDIDGFGECPSSAGGWTVDSMADALADWLIAAGIPTQVVVLGLSMGGYVALAFARRHPNHSRALVLADTKAEPDGLEARTGRDAAIQAVQKDGSVAQVEAALPKIVGPTTHARRPDVVTEFRRIGSAQHPDAVIAGLIALRDRPDARPGLAAINVPTLVIVGGEDAITPPSVAEAMAAGIRGSKLVVLPGAGHLSNLEVPDEFNATVLDFLDGLGST